MQHLFSPRGKQELVLWWNFFNKETFVFLSIAGASNHTNSYPCTENLTILSIARRSVPMQGGAFISKHDRPDDVQIPRASQGGSGHARCRRLLHRPDSGYQLSMLC
jgi:hypothetical protein